MEEAAQDTLPIDVDTQTFELKLSLPSRPLLPKKAVQLGLPETPSPLLVAVTPSETLNDLRATINDSPEGYWLGAFAFRKPKSNERIAEWIPLAEVFSGVPMNQCELEVVHVPYTDTSARTHLQRLRDLLTGGQADPSALSIDAGASVHDAVVRPEEYKSDQPIPAADQWNGWPKSSTELLYPAVSRHPRSLPRCLRNLYLSAWNPPPQPIGLKGHLLYIVAETLEGEALHITASVNGFFVSKSTSGRFDPYPSDDKEKAALASASLFDILCAASALFLRNFANLFNDPVSSRDYFSALPVMNTTPAAPWIARLPRHDADLLRSQTAFLLTGAMSSDTLDSARDWNEELQSSRELPKSSLAERLMRDRVLNRLYAELGLAAARAVPRVASGEVTPFNPADAPEAHMYLFNNLFVSKGVDGVNIYPYLGADEAAHVAVSKDAQGVRLFSAVDPDGLYLLGTVIVDWLGERWVVQTIVPGLFKSQDQASATEAQQNTESSDGNTEIDASRQQRDTQSVDPGSAPNSTETDSTNTAAMATVAYGGVEGPETIHTDPEFAKVLRPAAERLRLSEHSVKDANGVEHNLWVSLDSKGIRGSDGRKYLLDVSRTCPVDIAFLEKDFDSAVLEGSETPTYPHRMTLLRPELLELYYDHCLREFAREKLAQRDPDSETPTRIDVADFHLSFNPDAFVEYSMGGEVCVPVNDESIASVQAVRNAGEYLRDQAIPRFVSDVAAGIVSCSDGFALSQQMHARGINMRYLGKVAHLCGASEKDQLASSEGQKVGPGYEALQSSVRRIAIEEMIVRAAKYVLRQYLRGTLPTAIAPCIAHFLNCFLGFAREADPKPEVPSMLFDERGTSNWASLTPSSLQAEVYAEVRKRFRYELPTDTFHLLHKPQVLRAFCLRTGLQLRLLEYEFQPNNAANLSKSEPRSRKQKGQSKKAQNNLPAPRPTTFVPEDILNVVPIVKTSTPKSNLVDEAFEAGRLAFARGDRELGTELLLEGIGFHEQVYGLVHPETARCYSLFASLAHHFVMERARAEAEQAEKSKAGQTEDEVDSNAETKQGEESATKEENPQQSAQETETTSTDVGKVNGSSAAAIESDSKEDQAMDAKRSSLLELPAIVSETITIDNALRFQRQAVTISERTLGMDHPDTMMQYMNLAVIERTAGNLDNALRYQHRVLTLWQVVYGDDHPDAIHTLSSIGLLLQGKRDFRTSLRVYQAAYDHALRLFGPESLYTGNMAHELSQAYTLSGDLKNAINVEKGAWRIFQQRLGDDDAVTKESKGFLTSLTTSAVHVARYEQAGRPKPNSRGTPRPRTTNQSSHTARPPRMNGASAPNQETGRPSRRP
ncbi:Intracellular distribution of mitochondria [Malassezia yamatoensis]|uniref:Clustered mitochondria protein homolog n=1 Tax=Malassezia yamatoensis TaxID=253288 RepID=A0AAJ6CI43_9BASI|nr:Intracellular distribution of mitochondria [Malassezia yamatoensis]